MCVCNFPYHLLQVKFKIFNCVICRTRRACNKDFEFKGFKIPAGENVSVNSYDIHYNEEYWPDPKTFNPEK